jgi:hypothetical protein
MANEDPILSVQLLKDYDLAFRAGLCFFFAPAATFAYSEMNASRTVVRTLAN